MATPRRTQVGIIGAGPAGLLLARLLHLHNIEAVVLERRSRAYVESRVRAGVLEPGTARILEAAGAAEHMHRDCLNHHGVHIACGDRVRYVDLTRHSRASLIVYGQTEITKDLNQLNLDDGIAIHFDAEVTAVDKVDCQHPAIEYTAGGQSQSLVCDFVAGCDGYHGVSRKTIPASLRREYEKSYPFGWLGVMSDTRPAAPELIYASAERGFALCSQRSASVSRNYLQVPIEHAVEQWSDDAFWDELRRRLPAEFADALETGPSTEKSIAPLRSFVCEPMRHGALYLVGDAAHIVPPTGAKGLNLAASDAAMLASALAAWFGHKDSGGLERYSDTALQRVWAAERFSWWFTSATHRMSDNVFDRRIQMAELEHTTGTLSGLTAFSNDYVGHPIVDPVSCKPMQWPETRTR